MTSFFPDLNVWVALSVEMHTHSQAAWTWKTHLGTEDRLVFSRYTQLGLLRLLTNEQVMGSLVMTVGDAWHVYDAWIGDPNVEFYPEPRSVEAAFRRVTNPFAHQSASKSIGDCYLLAFASATSTVLVTFDKALSDLAHRSGHDAIMPA